MTLKDKIRISIKEFLDETDRRKVQLIDFDVPSKHIQIRIMESEIILLGDEKYFGKLILHVSIKNKHMQSDQIVAAMNLFNQFESILNDRSLIYYKIFDKEEMSIVDDTLKLLQLIIPDKRIDLIDVRIIRRDNWITLQE